MLLGNCCGYFNWKKNQKGEMNHKLLPSIYLGEMLFSCVEIYINYILSYKNLYQKIYFPSGQINFSNKLLQNKTRPDFNLIQIDKGSYYVLNSFSTLRTQQTLKDPSLKDTWKAAHQKILPFIQP